MRPEPVLDRETIEEAFVELKPIARSGSQLFTARSEPGGPPKVGETIDVAFRAKHFHFFDLEIGKALR